MEISQFKNLDPMSLEKAVYSDREIDIRAKEHVVGHDWADYEDALTYDEKDAIHTFKSGYLSCLRNLLSKISM